MTGQRRLYRALAVVAVLAGLLAMHGLATGHHASAHAPTPPAAHAAVAAMAATDHVAAASHHAADWAERAKAAALPGQLPTLSPADDCNPSCPVVPAATTLCLAVLTGLALGLHLARSHRLVQQGRRRRPPPAARTGRVVVPRRPDLVAELCVSRT